MGQNRRAPLTQTVRVGWQRLKCPVWRLEPAIVWKPGSEFWGYQWKAVHARGHLCSYRACVARVYRMKPKLLAGRSCCVTPATGHLGGSLLLRPPCSHYLLSALFSTLILPFLVCFVSIKLLQCSILLLAFFFFFFFLPLPTQTIASAWASLWFINFFKPEILPFILQKAARVTSLLGTLPWTSQIFIFPWVTSVLGIRDLGNWSQCTILYLFIT